MAYNAEKARQFWSRVKILGDDDCWEWQGPVSSKDGYVRIKRQRKQVYAHRYAWETQYGPLNNQEIDHKCRNRKCLNLSHLQSVTKGFNAKQAPHSFYCNRGHIKSSLTWRQYGSRGQFRCRLCLNINSKNSKDRVKNG